MNMFAKDNEKLLSRGNKMKCKDCIFCTWACPGWMCMNKKHPDFETCGEDCPVSIKLEDDNCNLFCFGDNDYKKFEKETTMKSVSDYPMPTYGMGGTIFKLRLSFEEYYGYACSNKTEIVNAAWDDLNECFRECKSHKQILDENIVAWEIN